MSLPIIDTLEVLGDFPAVKGKDVSVNDSKRLNDVLEDHEVRISELESGGGGGEGTTNYNLLENKPSINGVELKGNKSLPDLGIPKTKDDIGLGNVDNTSDANKPISTAVRTEINRINDINNDFETRITVLEESGGGGGGEGTTNYNSLENKPKINGVELESDKTLEDLGINIPTNLSELNNDAGYSKFSGAYNDLTGKPEIPNVPQWAMAPAKPGYEKSEIGLSYVDNTSDANKPISNATQAALDEITENITASTTAIENNTVAIETERARIDSLIGTVPAGSADEVADARIMADGNTAANLGNAIRTQINDIKDKITTNEAEVKDITSDVVKTGGFIRKTNGNYVENAEGWYTEAISCSPNDTFFITGTYQFDNCCIATYDSSGTFIRSYYQGTSSRQNITSVMFVPAADEKQVRFSSLYRNLYIGRLEHKDINKVVEKIANDSYITSNRIDNITRNFLTSEKYITRYGGVNDFAGAKLTDIIPCDISDVYFISAQYRFQSAPVTTYDANGNFLRAYGNNTDPDAKSTLSNFKFVPQPDEKGVRFCSYPDGVPFEIMKCDEKEPTKDELKARTEYEVTERFVDITSELQIEDDTFVSRYGGIIKRGNGGRATTNLTACDTSDTFRVTANGIYDACCIATFAADGTFVEKYGVGTSSEAFVMNKFEFVPNENEKYVLFSTYPASKPLVIERKQKTMTLKEKISEISANAKGSGSVLAGKKWVACGDSFTVGAATSWTDKDGRTGKDSPVAYDPEKGMWKSWAWHIADRNGMNLINEAISGSVFTNISGGQSPFSVSRYLNVPQDADYITLMFGLNETNATIGSKTDTGNTTLWGAYNTVLTHFYTNMPFAKIGVIIADAWMTERYANAVQEICKYWGVPCLNLKADERVPIMLGGKFYDVNDTAKEIKANAHKMSADDGHPNPYAHAYRSTIIENFMRSL